MVGLQQVPDWVPEPFRSEWQRTGDPLIAGFMGAFKWWIADGSPFRWLLDEEAVEELLRLPGVTTVDAGPV